MDCIVNKPYPEIKVEGVNYMYAEILLQDYAGVASETTAILLYSYQQFEKFNENDEFYKMIEKISISEMTHLEMLGKLIKLLGVNPIYKTVSSDHKLLVPWNADNINYSTDLEEMLKIDIKAEQEAIINYQNHIELIEDKYIKEILERIIEDEKKHIECFKSLLYKYKEEKDNECKRNFSNLIIKDNENI